MKEKQAGKQKGCQEGKEEKMGGGEESVALPTDRGREERSATELPSTLSRRRLPHAEPRDLRRREVQHQATSDPQYPALGETVPVSQSEIDPLRDGA